MALPLDVLEFQNENTRRAFPIKETCDRTSTDGLFRIPDELIADLVCSIDSDSTKRHFISRVIIDTAYVLVEISNESAVEGTFTVSDTTSLYSVTRLTPSTAYASAAGKITTGDLQSVTSGVKGTFYFTIDQAELEERCFSPSVATVSRIIFTKTDGSSYSASGTVVINAGGNLRFGSSGANEVTLNAGDGLGLSANCASVSPVIKTINGVSPDAEGNFNFDTSDCAALSAITNGILLTNECCKPCSSCAEIEELLSRLMTVETNLINLRNSYQTVLSEYEALKQALACSCSC